MNLRFTLAQLNPKVGDLDSNMAKLKDVWQQHDTQTDLLITSELYLCGYPPEDLVLKPSFMARIHAFVDMLVSISASMQSALLLGTPWTEDNKLYNAALLIHNGKIEHKYYKHELPNYGVFDEHRIFSKGQNCSIANFKGHKLGIQICEDMWFPHVSTKLKNNGAEALIVLNGSPFTAEKDRIRKDLAQQRVSETNLPLIYVNQVGGQDELVFDGGSFVINAQGNITASFPFFDEKVETSTLADTEMSAPKSEEIEQIYKALCLGLHDYVEKNGFPGVILGLSGGIDSALSAAIAVDALGSERVRAIMLPSPFTSQDSLDDAAACAQSLGISYETIPIKPAMAAFESSVDDLTGLAHENMQSRARGLILMALSNRDGYMVLTTGNKSEVAVGYATLYGDMCGGFNALKDIYKTQVYALSQWRNAQGLVIPERIITKAPTAELRDNQRDQDSLPSYDVLDDILMALIEDDLGLEETIARGHDEALVKKVWTLFDRAEYKRRQAAPGVKITSKAFGRDRRYPITNGYKE